VDSSDHTLSSGPRRDDAATALRLRLAVMRLTRRMRGQSGSDLTPSQISALGSVERHGPLTLGELAALERIKPPSVTRIVAALQQLGLARRERDAGDRRVWRVTLTDEGRATLQKSRSRKTAYLEELLSPLPDDEVLALQAALDVLDRLLGHAPGTP
jgi:DNA-binding MarR family transcriptional regulator